VQLLRRLALALAIYAGVVVAFESVVAFFGRRDAQRAHGPGDAFVVLTTTDAAGSPRDTVVAAVEVDDPA
jgi:hypothetical protein